MYLILQIKKMHKQLAILISILFTLITIQPIEAQEISDKIYDNNINTVLFFKKGSRLSFPAIALNSYEKLILKFDDLNQEQSDYIFQFIHCNSNWVKSNLSQIEYLNTQSDFYFPNPETSFSTRVDYNHYTLEFPNYDINFLKSGNYIIRVIRETTKEIIFDKRFIVYENSVSAQINIKRPDIVAYMDEYQQINFSLSSNIFNAYDINKDLKVFILQNERWDNALKTLKPRILKADELIYDHGDANTMPAGNEYRQVNIKSFNYKTENIEEIRLMGAHYTCTVKPDKIRRYEEYSNDQDLNGHCFISFDASAESDIKADYSYLYFSLPMDAPDIEGDVYLIGEITNRELSPRSKMEYNYQTKAYEKYLWVKQGYFDYQYALVRYNDTVGDASHFEGDFYKTENEYQIIIYLFDQQYLFDRVVGFFTANSANK